MDFTLNLVYNILATIIVMTVLALWAWRRSRRVVLAEVEQLRNDSVWTLALPRRPPPDRPEGVSPAVAREWLDKLGAVEVGEVSTRVRLTGLRQRDVLVTNIAARIIQEFPPLSAAKVESPDAGATERLSLYFDLDASPADPVRQTSGKYDPVRESEPYFRTGYITLKKDEVVELDLIAGANMRHYRFYWEMTIRTGKSTHKKRIGSDATESVVEVTAASPTYQEDLIWAWHKKSARMVNCDDPTLWEEDY